MAPATKSKSDRREQSLVQAASSEVGGRICYIHPFLRPSGDRAGIGIASVKMERSNLLKSEFFTQSPEGASAVSELFCTPLPQPSAPAGTGWCGLHLM